jgi:hypothetical protein
MHDCKELPEGDAAPYTAAPSSSAHGAALRAKRASTEARPKALLEGLCDCKDWELKAESNMKLSKVGAIAQRNIARSAIELKGLGFALPSLEARRCASGF